MTALKTAEELYRKHRSDHTQSNIPSPMYFDSFREALIEHDKEIRDKIEEMIKGLIGKSTHGSCCTCSGCKHYYEDDDCTCKEIEALTELLTFMEEK